MKSKPIVRIANSADWLNIQSFLASVPMSSKRQLIITRHGPMEMANPGFSHTSLYFIGEYLGETFGICHLSVSDRLLNNKIQKIAYFSEARIRPDLQGQGFGRLLISGPLKWCRDHGIFLASFLVNEGNMALFHLLDRIPDTNHKIQRTFKTSSYFVSKWHHLEHAQFIPVQVTHDGIAKLLTQLRQQNCFYSINPIDLLTLVQTQKGIQFFADRANPQELVFALWNQEDFRKLSILNAPVLTHLLYIFWNTLHPFTRMKKIPPIGKPWRQLELCFHNPLYNLTNLIPSALSFASQQDVHFLNVLSNTNQILLSNLQFPRVVTRSHYVAVSLHESAPALENLENVYVDLAFV